MMLEFWFLRAKRVLKQVETKLSAHFRFLALLLLPILPLSALARVFLQAKRESPDVFDCLGTFFIYFSIYPYPAVNRCAALCI